MHVLSPAETLVTPASRAAAAIISAAVAREELIVGVSGGSGALLARRFVEVLLTRTRVGRVHLVFSEASLGWHGPRSTPRSALLEDWVTSLGLTGPSERRLELHPNDRVSASIASGLIPGPG